MSVLRYYGCTDLCIRIFGSLVCNIRLISDLCLVLCCDIYRDTLISSMYSACMIKYMIVNRGRYKLVSEPTACRKCWNYALEAIINCIIIIPGSLLMFICLCYNCNGLCGGLPSSMLTTSGGKPICRCGI